jgi:hypothetical protein
VPTETESSACKVAERVSLSVVRAWPAANRRIWNRHIARLLLQFAAAGRYRAEPECRGEHSARFPTPRAAYIAVSRSTFTLMGRQRRRWRTDHRQPGGLLKLIQPVSVRLAPIREWI